MNARAEEKNYKKTEKNEMWLGMWLRHSIGKRAYMARCQCAQASRARESVPRSDTVRNSTCKICANSGKPFWKEFPWKMRNCMEILEFCRKFQQENDL